MQSEVRKTHNKKTFFRLQTDILLRTSHCEQGCSCVEKKKKLEGAIQINKRNNMAARAARGVFSEVFRDLILIRNNSYTVHV